jgi:hypothetical protein
MGEKKGSTAKIIYDFPTEQECQVQIKDKWYRATPRDFRSWGSKRQIIYNNPDRTQSAQWHGTNEHHWSYPNGSDRPAFDNISPRS